MKIPFIILMLFSINAFAGFPIPEVKVIKASTDRIYAVHVHDLENKGYTSLRNNILLYGIESIFADSLNAYSYIFVLDKLTGDTLFRQASPVFSKLEISDNQKYIIALSSIKTANNYQMVIYDLQGNIVFKKRIDDYRYLLNKNDLTKLAATYKYNFIEMVNQGFVSFKDDTWRIYPIGPSLRSDTAYRSFLENNFKENFDREFETYQQFFGSHSAYGWYYDSDDKITQSSNAVKITEQSDSISEIWVKNIHDSFIRIPVIDSSVLTIEKAIALHLFTKEDYVRFQDTYHSSKIVNESVKYLPGKYMQVAFGRLTGNYTSPEAFLLLDSLRIVKEPNKEYDYLITGFEYELMIDDSTIVAGKQSAANIPLALKQAVINTNQNAVIYFWGISVQAVLHNSAIGKTRFLDSEKLYIVNLAEDK